MLSMFVLAYGFMAMFVISSLARNRREARPDAPILALVGHGMMSASAAGACLVLGATVWTVMVH